MESYVTSLTGWVAVATGAAGLLAVTLIILLYAVGGVFGPLNDISNGVLGVLSAASRPNWSRG